MGRPAQHPGPVDQAAIVRVGFPERLMYVFNWKGAGLGDAKFDKVVIAPYRRGL